MRKKTLACRRDESRAQSNLRISAKVTFISALELTDQPGAPRWPPLAQRSPRFRRRSQQVPLSVCRSLFSSWKCDRKIASSCQPFPIHHAVLGLYWRATHYHGDANDTSKMAFADSLDQQRMNTPRGHYAFEVNIGSGDIQLPVEHLVQYASSCFSEPCDDQTYSQSRVHRDVVDATRYASEYRHTKLRSLNS